MINNKVNENVNELINGEIFRIESALTEILNLLFFKNYAEGHINYTDRNELLELINEYVSAGSEGEEYYKFKDISKVNKVIKRIRDKIGLNAEVTNPYGF